MFEIRSLIKNFFDYEVYSEIFFLKAGGKLEFTKKDFSYYKEYFNRNIRKARKDRWQRLAKK